MKSRARMLVTRARAARVAGMLAWCQRNGSGDAMYYKIMSGKDGGAGSFLCPPGHPAHTHSIYGWGSKSWATRGGAHAARYIGSIDNALTEAGETRPGYKDRELAALAPAVRRLYDAADMRCSELWLRNVYGYFRGMYAPEDLDRSVTRAISASRTCTCGAVTIGKLDRHLAEHEGEAGHGRLSLPPERHLAYLMVREHFPDHEPRLDLIANPGDGYGAHSCPKCGQGVQYEARFDAFARIASVAAPWRYETDCPEGGRHE